MDTIAEALDVTQEERDLLNTPLETTPETEASYAIVDSYLIDAARAVVMDDPRFAGLVNDYSEDVVLGGAYMALALRAVTLADRHNPGGRFKILLAQLRDPNLVDVVAAAWPLIEALSVAPVDTED